MGRALAGHVEPHAGSYTIKIALDDYFAKHGRYTAETIERRREISALVRAMKSLASARK
jgi:hypothetical protein